MEKCALYHKSKSSYAYAYDQKTLHIKMKSKKGDVKKATLLYGDPYDFRSNFISGNLADSHSDWNKEEKQMTFLGSDQHFDYWLAEVEPKWRRLKYAFLLNDDDSDVLYGEKRIIDITEENQSEKYNQSNFFSFPFLNGIDVFKGPEWVKETIWYQIFPERFEDGDISNNPKNCKEWHEPVESPFDKYGGDLQGIINRLDYLQELGITGVYLTPIFQADSNHKYDTIDYFNIDPQFGDTKTMKRFVDECHKRNIKVMLDAVFNHCGFYAHEFQDVIENGEKSVYKDWFHIKKFPVFDADEGFGVSKSLNYDTFAFTPMMPKLNTENETVKSMLLDAVKYWTIKLGIDGWRLDVANEVDHQFWRDFRKLVKDINPECYILGEIWHDATAWLQGEQFDGVMNYPLYEAVLDFFAKDKIDSTTFMESFNHAMFMYPENVNAYMYNLLDSHDTARVKHIAGEDIGRVKLAYLFMLTNQGAPTIYYGDEIGMTGGVDPDCRRPMIWDQDKQDLDMFKYIQTLISIRKANPALSNQGSFHWHETGLDKILLYQRSSENDGNIYVIINNSDDRVKFRLPDTIEVGVYENLFNGNLVNVKQEIKIGPFGYYLLKGV